MNKVYLNKNRGWRGLAELQWTKEDDTIEKRIFSFSSNMWYDLVDEGKIVVEDDTYFHVLKFTDKTGLPAPSQQRSVLIKNFSKDVEKVFTYKKTEWRTESSSDYNYGCIIHFLRNSNNHTTSEWNCIGIRVVPTI